MRFRTTRARAPAPKRWLVYSETASRSTVVEFSDYVEAVEYAQNLRRDGATRCIEVGDALGRVVWEHTGPT